VNILASFVRPIHASTRHVARATALLLLAWMLAGCHRAPAEQQVREAIDAAAVAARANDTRGVLDVVSDDFTGNEGELDRRGLRQLLAVRALRGDKAGLLVGPVSFEHKGDRIIAKFNLVLTGGKPGDLLPEQSAIYAMTTAWRREGGEWKCYSASWSQ
jgi:ketosteroid isomerase-like protein